MNSAITPKTQIVPRGILNNSTSDSGFCVVPCLSDSQPSSSYHEDITNEEDKVGEMATPEDPLIDFHRSRKLRRKQKHQNEISEKQEMTQKQSKEIVHKVPDIVEHNSTKAQVNCPKVFKPLLPKDIVRIWSNVDHQPLKFSTDKLKLTFGASNLKNIKENGTQSSASLYNDTDKNNDVINVDDEAVGKNASERGKDISVELKGNSTQLNENHKVVFQTISNSNKKTVVKATKFFLNGEICYLIPAKILVDQSNQDKVGQSTNEKTGKTSVDNNNRLSTEELKKQNEIAKKNKEYETAKRLASLKYIERFLKLVKPFQCFSELFSVDDLLNTFSESRVKRERFSYPSIRRVKSSKNNTPRLRISTLDGANKSTDDRSKGGRTKRKDSKTEEKKIRLDDSEKENEFHSVRQEHSQQKFPSNKEKQNKIEERVLKLIIQSPKSGTLFFLDNKQYKDQVDAFINRKVNEHPSESVHDQIVPDPNSSYAGCSPSINATNIFDTPFLSLYQQIKSKGKTYCQDFRDAMRDLKDLTKAGHKMTEDELLISAEACIKNLEGQVKDLLRQFGVDVSSRTLDQIIPMSCMTSSDEPKDECRQKITAVNPNSITTYHSNSETSNKYETEAGFLIPHSLPSSYERSLYVPSSQDTNSPNLSVGGNNIWAPGNSQAHNDVVLSQGSSQSVFHRSSQVSFSDSVTDDSEAMNEFDLNFETEGKEERSSKVIFQAFVEELLRDVDETDLNDEDPTVHDEECNISTFQQDFFNSPLSNIQPDSPLLFTPPQFSVNNLASDLQKQTDANLGSSLYSPDVQMVDESNGGNILYQSLSLKVIGRANHHVIANNLCQSPTLDRLVPNTVLANENSEQQSYDSNQSASVEDGQSLTKTAPKMILARDLIKSDFLASFLKPSPVLIPEDPFGIGAETLIGDDEAQKENWQDVEVTPIQTKRGIDDDDMPPKIERKRKRGRPRKGEAAKATTTKHSKKFCISRFDSPPQRK